MTRRQAIHVRLYRWYLKLTPPAHRDRHGEDQLQLFADLVASGQRPWRLWVGAVPDLVAVLRTSPRRTVISVLARIGLYPLSVLNTVAGLALVGIAVGTADVPIWVTAPAAAVAVQGVYTLMWLLRRAPVPTRVADRVFTAGEALALAVAGIGIVAAVIAQSASSDPEFGPPTMMTLVATHALLGLLAAPRAPADQASALA